MGKLKAEEMKLLSPLKAGNVTKANKVSGNPGAQLRTPSISAVVAMTTTDIACNGLEPNASGSSGEGSAPIQCYKCWGWGHTRCNCPSWLNFTRGS